MLHLGSLKTIQKSISFVRKSMDAMEAIAQ